MVHVDHEAIEAQGGELDPQEGMEPQDPWDQLALKDSQGGMGYPLLEAL